MIPLPDPAFWIKFFVLLSKSKLWLNNEARRLSVDSCLDIFHFKSGSEGVPKIVEWKDPEFASCHGHSKTTTIYKLPINEKDWKPSEKISTTKDIRKEPQ